MLNKVDGVFHATNWDNVEEMIDKITWEKLNNQFWLDTRIPVSNDLPDWRKLTDVERELYDKVFGGLTLLDTMQGQSGNYQLMADSRNDKEVAILSQICFMEHVHAKSYSTIFTTLRGKTQIEGIFDWVAENKELQFKATEINAAYELPTKTGDDNLNQINALKKKATSVMLESFLFYSGFYTPLYYLGKGKMINCAEIIRLILRDESVNCVPI